MIIAEDIHAVYEHALRLSACHAYDLQCIEYESLERIAAVARGICVEIGTRHGISTLALLRGAEHVYSIDIDKDCAGLFPGDWPWTFICNQGALAAEGWSSPVSVLLIDDNHTYESVSTALAAWAPHLVDHADIFLHDAYPENAIRRAISDFCDPRGLVYGYQGMFGHIAYTLQ